LEPVAIKYLQELGMAVGEAHQWNKGEINDKYPETDREE